MHDVDETLRRVTALANAGDFDVALEIAEELRQRFPDDPRALGVLGATLYRADRFEEALPWLRQATLRAPRAELPSLVLFHCLWDMGLQGEARSEVARFLRCRPSQEYDQLLVEMGWRFDDEKQEVVDVDVDVGGQRARSLHRGRPGGTDREQ